MLDYLEWVLTIEDVSRIALRAGASDYFLVIEFECPGTTDDGGNPKLPRYNRSVTGSTPFAGDD